MDIHVWTQGPSPADLHNIVRVLVFRTGGASAGAGASGSGNASVVGTAT